MHGTIKVAAHPSTNWDDPNILNIAEQAGNAVHESSGWETHEGVNLYIHRFTLTR